MPATSHSMNVIFDVSSNFSSLSLIFLHSLTDKMTVNTVRPPDTGSGAALGQLASTLRLWNCCEDLLREDQCNTLEPWNRTLFSLHFA